jgi:ubiquinone/menaquinone biosynthesis C-methylase UbiE
MTTNTTHPAAGATPGQEDVTPPRAYEEYFGPAIFQPLARLTLRHAAPRTGERVLDLACGTGIVARRVAAAVGSSGHVLGIDINPGMLEEARHRAQAAGVSVEWQQGDAVTAAVPEGAFDLVVCQQGLQFFGERLAGARLMHRSLRTGGRAVVVTWRGLDHHPLFRALADAETPHLASLGAGVSRVDVEAPFSLGDPGELRRLLERAGFRGVTLADETIEARFADPDHFVHRMERAYAAVVPRLASDPRAFADYLDRIVRETREVVTSHRRGDHIVAPMHAIVAVADA